MSPLVAARTLWRRAVPERLRLLAQPVLGQALQTYTRISARRPQATASVKGPIKIVGLFGDSHGITASARLATKAFASLGVPVELVDVSGSVLTWSGRYAAPQQASAWIFYLNAPELLAAMACLGPRSLIGPRYGYWAWELPKAPDRWLKDGAMVDEIWAPSRYTADALAGARAPVRVVRHPLAVDDYAGFAPAPRTRAFQVVALFDFNSSAARKNPLGIIEAFRRAFGDDPNARLTIKTQKGALYPELLASLTSAAPANVEILDAVWPYERVMGLIAGADALISLHRAEGFGLTLAEAMALGVPVVATAFSGNLDFMDETSAELIPAAQIPVDDPQGIYSGQTWADPDLDAAARALVRLRNDPGRRESLRAAARQMIASRLSPQAWFGSLPRSLQAAAASLRESAS